MVTLSEVAKRANVTAATVSNVLRNRDKVRPETAERVLNAISELGYRPNLNARALAEGRSSTLALMLSNISNPFYPEFVLAAERAARRAGHILMVCNTDDDAAIGRAYLHQIAGTLAEGVLMMNTDIAINELCESATGRAPLLLTMWERPESPPGLSCVAVDLGYAGGPRGGASAGTRASRNRHAGGRRQRRAAGCAGRMAFARSCTRPGSNPTRLRCYRCATPSMRATPRACD